MEKLESVPALVVGLRRGPHAFLILNSDRFLLLSNLPDTFPPVTVRLPVTLVGDGGGFPEAQARQILCILYTFEVPTLVVIFSAQNVSLPVWTARPSHDSSGCLRSSPGEPALTPFLAGVFVAQKSASLANQGFTVVWGIA